MEKEYYEDNIILPPPESRDDNKPILATRTKEIVVGKPVPIFRTKITLTDKVLKGFTYSFEITITIKNKRRPFKNCKMQCPEGFRVI